MRNSTPICLHLQTLMNAYHRSAQKRIFDLTFSIVVLPFALVAVVLGSILILVTTGGSFLYCQKRVGRDGKEFTIYKLRTLKRKAYDDLSGMRPNDPDLIGVGLDQGLSVRTLWNVVRTKFQTTSSATEFCLV